jgi:hypothetical protein
MKYRRCRRFAIARQADSNIRMLAFARAINDAAHNGNVQVLNPIDIFLSTSAWKLERNV